MTYHRIRPPANGPEEPIEQLIANLSDVDSRVRWRAARALGLHSDRRGAEPLVQALKDSDAYVREIAARSLGWLCDTRAVKPLVSTLADEGETRACPQLW